MKNFLIKLAFVLWIIWFMTLVTSCSSSLPAARYAKEHRSKEFTSWKTINKKIDTAEKSKPKEHAKRNRY
jgi:hypothetical protein